MNDNKSLKNLYSNIIKYLYTNRLFIIYFVFSLIGTILLRKYTVGLSLGIKPIISDISLILLIGSIGYLIKPEKRFTYYFWCLIIFTTAEVVNSIYYIFYSSFASFAELSTLSQTETVTDSIFVQLKFHNFIYIIFPLFFGLMHNRLRKSPYYNIMNYLEKGKIMFISTLIIGILCLITNLCLCTKSDFSRLSKQWNRSYIVERFGIILYQGNDLFQTVKPKISSLFGYEEAKILFDNYFSNNTEYRNDNKYTGILEGYNIVYVHMESMQNFLMDLNFNGVEAAPNLKKLTQDGLFFSNFYPQVSTGTSSDAEYIMLSGLLPSSNGTVFVSYQDNTFNTIVSNLSDRNYYTFSMHGNYSSMWNRINVHPKLGYKDMYYRESFNFTDEDVIGLGINDKLFFEQAIQKLEEIENNNENYFGTIITLSNHSPFALNEAFTLDINDYFNDEETGEQISTCYLCNRDIGKYIRSAHYADEALGEFLNYINNSDNFENTVFVFYGDHDAKISYKDMNYLYNYDPKTGELKDENDATYIDYDTYDHNLNKKTPLVIWTKNSSLKRKLSGEVKNVMGMYDAAPTLYNMLNIDNPYVLGHDIFNIKENNIVVFPNGNYLTNSVYYNNSTGEYKKLNSDANFDNNYIKTNAEYAELVLEVGNAIINYDLFNERSEEK